MRRRGLYCTPRSRCLKKRLAAAPFRRSCTRMSHDAVLIHRTPQIMQRASDADEYFVAMPGVSWLWPAPAQPSGEGGTELQTPMPNALVGNQRASRLAACAHQCKSLECGTSRFAFKNGQGAVFSSMSAAFSPIMIDGALVLPDVSVGMIEASAIRRPVMP